MKDPQHPRGQLIRHGLLTPQDLGKVAACRGDHNRLGFGYQIGFVRLFNRFPAQSPFEIYEDLVKFTAMQLHIDAERIEEYAARQPTVSKHQAQIREYLRLRSFGPDAVKALEEFVFEESYRLEQTSALLSRAAEFLKKAGVLLPADYALRRIVGEQRNRARACIFQKVAGSLPQDFSKALDELLDVQPGEAVSPLQNIKANPAKPSAQAMLSLVGKLKTIEATGALAVDLGWLNGNLQRALFHYVRKCSVDQLRQLEEPRRKATLLCFLWQSYRDSLDQAVDMFDKLLTRVHTHAEHELDERMREQRRTIQALMVVLRALGQIILDDSVSDAELRERIFTAVPKGELQARVEGVGEWVTGKRSDVFHGVIRRSGYLKRFAPTFLSALEFGQESGETDLPCLEALKVFGKLNAEKRRTLPQETPMDFIPEGLLPVVEDAGSAQKRAWECALFVKLRDEIKVGNIFVSHSKRFGRFDDFFISNDRWSSVQESFFARSGLPRRSGEVPGYLTERLNQAYDLFLKGAPENSYATADDAGWHLSVDSSEKLDEEAQAKVKYLKDWLAARMRSIRLPELLIEVDNELRFTRHFMVPAQREERNPEDVCLILTALMAHGCNIGPFTMAKLTNGVSYKQLKRVSDWQFTEEAQRAALASLVQEISRLDTSQRWGEGRTSASDGQRFSMPRKVLQQTYSTKFSDFALEFYSFVADNYAPFYSTPIECTDRDAAFVLDGLLYNESDLELEEHYTDTHGYTEINFAAFAMLGQRFCPRIRGLQHQRIYRIDPNKDYGALKPLVSRADRKINPEIIVEQWDRMGQFYASLVSGHTTASVALKRLASYSAKNRFYRANRDLGRIFKTEFILSYMSDPNLRARVRQGLLKVEQLHSLARDVYYGRRGRINARELHEQMNSCSCLTLILACIIYWQAKEISRVLQSYDLKENNIDGSLLEHVSPIEWDNVILYGQYIVDRSLIR